MRSNPEQIKDAVACLVEYEIKMLESTENLKKLEILDMTNTKEYEKECENGQLYTTKEQRILDSIDCYPYEFEQNFQEIVINLTNYLPNNITENQIIKIDSRLMRILGQKCNELAGKYQNPEYEEDIDVINMETEFYGNDDLYEAINNQIEMQRITQLQKFIDQTKDIEERKEMIEEKFSLIYDNRIIHNQLLEAKMNPYFLFETPDDIIIKNLKIEKEKFGAQRTQQIIDTISDFIDFIDTDIFENINDVKQIIKQDCDLAFAYFLLNKLPTQALTQYLIECEEEYNEFKESQFKLATNMINDVLKERNDYVEPSSELLERKTCFALPEQLLEQFVSLIKLAELITIKHNILCELEKQNLNDSEEFEKNKKELIAYLEFEKDILDTFDFSSKESDTLVDILDNHLEILLKNKKNASSVKKRIGNMLPNLIDDFSAVAYEETISFIIHQTFILKTLKQFDEMIRAESNEQIKNKLLEEKYRQFSYHRCINEDMVSTNFAPSKVTILDEATIIELLDVHDFEYGYDKNVELYVLGNAIIHEIINSNQKHPNLGYVLYREICLEEILKNLNDENIIDLEHQFNTQMKNAKQSKKIDSHFKIKTIFKKAKPKYIK